MEKPYRIVHYINQFFGQIGGEESAFAEPVIKEGAVGPGLAFAQSLGSDYEIIATVICGDNYIAQDTQKATEALVQLIKEYKPHLLLAGPAFNAGRYGPACGAVCKSVYDELSIPVVTGMYEENPGVEMYRKHCYIVKTKDSAASMRGSVKTMSALVKKILETDEIPLADTDGYFSRGIRRNVFVEKDGAERSVDMLLAKINKQPFKSELEIVPFEKVEPAPPVKNLKHAKIALVTDSGLTDKTNTFHLESARATKYIELNLQGLNTLSPDDFCSVHGGFDPTYANTRPNVLVPLDAARFMEKEGIFNALHETLYSTTGNGTSLKSSQSYGAEIAQKLIDADVNGVILTST